MGAKLQLTVESNFDEATKDFKRFGDVSEDQQKRIDESLGKIGGRSKTTLSGLKDQLETTAKSYHNAGQGSKALGAQSRLLERKIFALTKAGGSGTEAMKVLQKELDGVRGTMRRNERRSKMLANGKKLLAAGSVAVAAAAAAAGAALIKNAFDAARTGDEYAKAARNIGVTAEELQQFNFIAERSGVDTGKMNNALKKMNENVGKARTGQGELFSMLSKTNPKLLEQVKNAESSGQAFELLMGELQGTANAADRTALAAAFFGRAGKEMGSIASLSAEEMQGLKDEVAGLGVMTNAQAAQAEALADSQHNLQTAIKGITMELGAKLFPVITRVMDVIVQMIKTGGPLRNMFENTVKAVAPVVKVLGKVMLAMWKLQAIIFDKVIGSIRAFVGAILKIPGVKKVFGAIGEGVKKFAEGTVKVAGDMSGSIDDAFDKTKFKAIENFLAMDDLENKKQQAYKDTTVVLSEESNKRLDLQAADVAAGKERQKLETANLAQRLSTEEQLEANSHQKRVTEILAFLENNRLAEGASFEAKVANMESERERILALDTLTADERVAVEEAFTQRMKKLSEDRATSQRAEIEQRVDNMTKFFSASVSLIAIFGKKSKKAQRVAAIAQKVLDISTATRKGILATQAAFAAGGGIPGGIGPAIATGAQAAANVAAIASTSIPTAQTGASIVVPDNPTTSRADTVPVIAGPGETVEVTPRGEESSRTVRASVYLGTREIYNTVQDGIDAGEITITDANIRAA